jgi:type IV pilus assembly protein PilA
VANPSTPAARVIPAAVASARSPIGFTLVEIMVVVTLIGLLVALAVPAYKRIVIRSQDQAVTNNARQLASAVNQYLIENGVTSVSMSALAGVNGYVKNINPVAGETYPATFTQGIAFTITGVGGARTITYAP